MHRVKFWLHWSLWQSLRDIKQAKVCTIPSPLFWIHIIFFWYDLVACLQMVLYWLTQTQKSSSLSTLQQGPFKEPKVWYYLLGVGEVHTPLSHMVLRDILSSADCTVLHTCRPVPLISVHRCHLSSQNEEWLQFHAKINLQHQRNNYAPWSIATNGV